MRCVLGLVWEEKATLCTSGRLPGATSNEDPRHPMRWVTADISQTDLELYGDHAG